MFLPNFIGFTKDIHFRKDFFTLEKFNCCGNTPVKNGNSEVNF